MGLWHAIALACCFQSFMHLAKIEIAGMYNDLIASDFTETGFFMKYGFDLNATLVELEAIQQEQNNYILNPVVPLNSLLDQFESKKAHLEATMQTVEKAVPSCDSQFLTLAQEILDAHRELQDLNLAEKTFDYTDEKSNYSTQTLCLYIAASAERFYAECTNAMQWNQIQNPTLKSAMEQRIGKVLPCFHNALQSEFEKSYGRDFARVGFNFIFQHFDSLAILNYSGLYECYVNELVSSINKTNYIEFLCQITDIFKRIDELIRQVIRERTEDIDYSSLFSSFFTPLMHILIQQIHTMLETLSPPADAPLWCKGTHTSITILELFFKRNMPIDTIRLYVPTIDLLFDFEMGIAQSTMKSLQATFKSEVTIPTHVYSFLNSIYRKIRQQWHGFTKLKNTEYTKITTRLSGQVDQSISERLYVLRERVMKEKRYLATSSPLIRVILLANIDHMLIMIRRHLPIPNESLYMSLGGELASLHNLEFELDEHFLKPSDPQYEYFALGYFEKWSVLWVVKKLPQIIKGYQTMTQLDEVPSVFEYDVIEQMQSVWGYTPEETRTRCKLSVMTNMLEPSVLCKNDSKSIPEFRPIRKILKDKKWLLPT